jgi:MFS transporter, DHA1 family, tetracycline resistance protein
MPVVVSNKKVLFVVFLTVFLDLVGFGILIPIQPFFAESLGASPATVTLLGAAYSAMQFLFAPFWGRLSDKVGRRPVMLSSIALGTLGYALFGWATTLPLLFAARMLAGFGNANIGAAQAVIADCTAPEERAKGMGLIGAAFGLGFIFGPAIGGIFSQFSLSLPAYVAAGLGAVNWLSAYFILPETHGRNAAKPFHRSRAMVGLSLQDLKRALEWPHVQHMLLIFLTITVGFSMMEQVIGLFIEHTWLPLDGGPESARQAARLTTYVLVIVGVTATIVQGGLIGRLVKAFGERHLLVGGPLITALSFLGVVLVGRSGTFSMMFVVCALMALGSGLSNPSMTSILSQLVDENERGTVLGLGQSCAALGRALGPAMAGVLFERNIEFPFVAGAALIMSCSLVATRLPKTVGAKR